MAHVIPASNVPILKPGTGLISKEWYPALKTALTGGGVPSIWKQGNASITYGNGTKGSWVEIVASTEMAATAIVVRWGAVANAPATIDIAIGTTVIIADIMQPVSSSEPQSVAFGISIPMGSQLQARGQATGATPSRTVQIMYGG